MIADPWLGFACEAAFVMARILFITSAHPGGSGFIGAGEGICESSLRTLVAAGYEVHVLCFASLRQQPNPGVVALCASYRTLVQSGMQSLFGILRGWRWGSLLAPWFFTRCSPSNLRVVSTALADTEFKEVWIDFPSSLGFAPYLGDRFVSYFVHDVVSQKVGRRPLLAFLARRVEAIEQRLAAFSRRCYVLSDKDGHLIRQLGYAGDIVVSPPMNVHAGLVEGGRPAASIVSEFSEQRNLVFFGNMRRPENHWSMMYFIAFRYRSIRRICPDVRLWILGIAPRRSLRLLSYWVGGVEVVGAVDDPVLVFQAATLCVVPLRFGAGVKIKVLQMLDAGATVVSTTVGAEGIAAKDSLVVADDAEFVTAVCSLMASQVSSRKAST